MVDKTTPSPNIYTSPTQKFRKDEKSLRKMGGIHSTDSQMSKYLRGFVRTETSMATPIRTDNQGLVFVTRPMCNLLTENIIGQRRLLWLTDTDPYSVGAAVNNMMMPNPSMYGMISEADFISKKVNYIQSAHIDPYNAWLPLFTTAISNVSGFPDRVTEFYMYDEGLAKEQHGHADHRPDTFESFDLNVTFKSTEGDFINGWIQAMWEYQGAVANGDIMPFPSMITRRELDYPVRFYRVVLDHTKTYVRKIFCTGWSILAADTSGADANYNSDESVVMDNNEISVPFKSFGVLHNDPMAILMFNKTTEHGMMTMKDGLRQAAMVKLVGDEKYLFDGMGYPRIDLVTKELEWWVPNALYNGIINGDLMGLI